MTTNFFNRLPIETRYAIKPEKKSVQEKITQATKAFIKAGGRITQLDGFVQKPVPSRKN